MGGSNLSLLRAAEIMHFSEALSPCIKTYGLEYWWRIKFGSRTFFFSFWKVPSTSAQRGEPELRILSACQYSFACWVPQIISPRVLLIQTFELLMWSQIKFTWDALIALHDRMAFREHRRVSKFAIFYATLNEKCFSHILEMLNHILQAVVIQNHKGISHIRNVNYSLKVGTSEMSNTPGFSTSTNSWGQISVKIRLLFLYQNQTNTDTLQMRTKRSCDILDKPGYKMERMNTAFIHCWCSWTLCCHS